MQIEFKYDDFAVATWSECLKYTEAKENKWFPKMQKIFEFSYVNYTGIINP